MFLSQESECSWKVKLHGKHSHSNPLSVLGNQLIRLQHTETKGLIGACIPHENSDIAEVYAQNYFGKSAPELNTLDTIWEVQHAEGEALGDIFACHRQTNALGEESRITSRIRLRHFLTGRYFSMIDFSKAFKIAVLSGAYQSVGLGEHSPIQFEPLLKGFDELLYGYSYYVKCVSEEDGNLYMRSSLYKVNADAIHHNFESDASNTDSGFNPIQNDSKYLSKSQVIIKKEFSTEDAYSIKQIDSQFVRDILFVRSGVLRLNNVLHKIRAKGVQSLSEEYSRVVKLIQQLICFVIDIDYSSEIDFGQLAAEANQQKQMIIKNMGIIEVLIDITMIPLQLEISPETQGSLMGAISFSYTGVKFIIQSYKPNELYASQWLRAIMTKSVEIEEKYNINTNSMLTELLDNNRRILESKIDEELIASFLQDILRTGKKHPKYLVTLTVLCMCNGEPIRKNQKVLCKLMLSKQEVMDKLNIRILDKSGDICFFDEVDKEVKNINTLGNKSENSKHETFRMYILQLIKLFSAICFQKNVTGINLLQKHFPYELCCKIITNTTIHPEVRAVFLSLVKDLWVNIEPYNTIFVPKQIVLWTEFQEHNFPMSKQDFSKHSKLISHVVRELQAIKESPNIRNNIKTLKLLQQLLGITKTFVLLGFLDKDQLNEVLTHIKDLLSAAGQLVTSEQNEKLQVVKSISQLFRKSALRYAPVEVAVLYDECRRIIGNILGLVLKFQTELRMEEFFSKFIRQMNKRRDLLDHMSDANDSVLEIKKEKRFAMVQTIAKRISKVNPLQTSQTRLLLSHDVIVQEPAFIENCVKVLSSLLEDSMGVNFDRKDNFKLIIVNSKNIENISLKTELLHLMNQIHTQSLYFKEVYSNVLFIDPERKKDFTVAQEAMGKLINISMTVTKWYDEQSPRELEELFSIIGELENSMNVPIRVCRFSKYVESTSDVTGEPLTPKISGKNEYIFEMYLQFKNNNPNLNMQDVMRNVGIFEQILKIIDYDLTFNYYVEGKRHQTLIKKLYQFIILSCRNNEVNKIYFAAHEKLFMEHMQIDSSIGVELLLDQILPCCRDAILDNDKFESVLNAISDFIIELSSFDASKSILLNCSVSLLYNEGEPIKSNQNRLINCIFRRNNEEILLDNFRAEGFAEKLTQEFQNFTIKFDSKNGKYLLINSNYINFVVAILNTLTACGEGKNSYSENYAQNVLSLDLIYKLLTLPNIDFLLKASLVRFLFDIFIEIENEGPLQMKQVFSKIIQLLFNEFGEVLEIFRKKGSPVSALYPSLTLSSTEYLTFNGIKSAEEVYRHYAASLVDCFITLANKESKIMANKASSQTSGDMSDIMVQITSISMKFSDVLDEEVKERLERLREACLMTEKREDFASQEGKPPGKATHYRKPTSTTIISRYVGKKALQPEIEAEESRLVEAYKMFHKVLTSASFNKAIEKEFEQWINIINHLEVSGEEETRMFIDFLKDTVNYFNNNMHSIDEGLALTGLKLFRKFIESVTGIETLTAVEWDSLVYEKFKTKIIRRQNLLLETAIVEWMCNILTQRRSPVLFESAIQLCIALLFGGNSRSQHQFHDNILQQTETNKLLINLNSAFSDRFNQIALEMKSANDTKLRNIINEKYDVLPKRDQPEPQILKKKTTLQPHRRVSRGTIEHNIFRFLQLLCEGHNSLLQNLLREQYPGSKTLVQIKNVNFITIASKYIGQLLKFVNPECVDLGLQIIDFLIESVQGPCQANQLMLFDTKAVEVVKDFMNDLMVQTNYFEQMFEGYQKELGNLVAKSISLLNSLLEANNDPKMISYMAQNLNFEFLVECLVKEFNRFVAKQKHIDVKNIKELLLQQENRRLWDKEEMEGFNIFFLLRMLQSSSLELGTRMVDLETKYPQAFEFYYRYSAHVEIVFEEKLITYYFVVHPACLNLDQITKQLTISSVSLDSPAEKIGDFMDRVPYLFDIMDDKAYMRSWRFQVNPNLYRMTRLATLVNTIVINLIMFVQFGKRAVRNLPVTNQVFDENEVTFQILAVTHNIASFFLIVYWFLLESRMSNMGCWRELLKAWRKEMVASPLRKPESEEDQLVMTSLSKNFAKLTSEEKYSIIRYRNSLRGFDATYNRLEYWVRTICHIFKDKSLTFLMRFCLLSILGLYFQTQGFLFGYSILMLDAIFWSETMTNVIKSITHGGAQFGLTALLAGIVVYNYSLFAFFYVDDTFFNKATGPNFGENICVSVFQCFLTILSLEPRSSGGVGDVILRQSFAWENRATYWARYIFDLTCFVIINLIFLNLLLGIIIDTFAALRDKKSKIEVSSASECFVCSLTQDIFSKQLLAFEKHVEEDHNVWNYLFFMYYLQNKDFTEHTGIESRVKSMIEREDSSWIPILKTAAISEDNLNERIELHLDKLLSTILEINGRLRSSGLSRTKTMQ